MSDVSILPASSSVQERALEAATCGLEPDPIEIGDLMDPSSCPTRFLPWLAHAMSVDEWEPAWPEATKREVIRQSVQVHRKKGTVGAVKRALRAIGAGIEIEEWMEYGGTPHTFRAFVDVIQFLQEGRTLDRELVTELRRTLDQVKPLRSQFDLIPTMAITATHHAGLTGTVHHKLFTRAGIPPVDPVQVPARAGGAIALVSVITTQPGTPS